MGADELNPRRGEAEKRGREGREEKRKGKKGGQYVKRVLFLPSKRGGSMRAQLKKNRKRGSQIIIIEGEEKRD